LRTNEGYSPGALRWMKKSRPEDWERMISLEKKIDQEALAGEVLSLKETLTQYKELILSVVRIFQKDFTVQEGLFSF